MTLFRRCRTLVFCLVVLCGVGNHALGSGPAIDARVSKDGSSAASNITTPTFSTTSSNELLLAFVATDYLGGTNTTVTSVSGAALTWALVLRTNKQSGTAEIWRAFAPSTLSNASVTASLSQSVVSSLTVLTFSGVDPSGAIGATATASAASGAPSASIVTTRNNSWVFGVGNDFDQAIARVPGAGQTLIHQNLTSTGDTYWVQMQTSATPASGTTVTINDTSPTADRYNLTIVEVLPAPSGSFSLSGAVTPSSIGSGTSVALTGASSSSRLADANGNYSFSNLVNGSYTVTPNKSGYIFSPFNQNVTITGVNVAGINFSGQPAPRWSISGTITPTTGGSGAQVALTGTATANTTTDSSGFYSFGGLLDGSYLVTPSNTGFTFTPSSQSASINGTNATGINFTASAASASIAIDARISKDAGTASPTVTSPVFSTTSSNELLLAFISTDYLGGANTFVNSVSGAGLSWTLVVRTNGQRGSAEIWRAFATSPLANVSVTASLSQSVASSLTVMSFSGVDASGALGAVASANASSGAPSATLTTTRNNSWVFGVGNDFDQALPRTPGTGQSLVHQYLSAAGDTYWVQMESTPTPVSGTHVTINDTSPTTDRFNLSLVEVLPGSGGGGGDTTPPTVVMTSPGQGAAVASLLTVAANASDDTSVAGIQFLIDGAALGSEVTTAPYSMRWDSTTVSNGSHTLSARARDSVGLTTTSAPVTINVDNSGNPAVVGSWSSVVSLPAVAVNLILLHNNKILFYQDGATPTIWDYTNNTFMSVPISVNLFCSGHALLRDGRVLVVGGFGGGSIYGIANAEIFDPATNAWTIVPDMAYRRWYPNATTLPDGKVLVTAGWQTTAHTNAGVSEIYDPVKNSWSQLTNANNPFETYPFLYMLADGRVLHIGGSEYATDTDIFDINAQSWSVVDSTVVDGGSASMFKPGMFVKAGSATDSQGVGPSSNTTFVLDMSQPSPSWRQTPSMVYPRSFLNLTMLPDGNVLATGGETDKDGGNIANAVYPAELWSSQTQTWTTMAAMHTPREYHGTALLLPDARVLVSGMGADFGNVPDQKSAEFFSPPYLFKGARPVISQTPSQLQYNSTIFLQTPDAASIAQVSLIRTGAVTHFFDQNERYLPLNFQVVAGGLNVTTPVNSSLAPPGYYMLFIVNASGVPSVAAIVQFP